MRAAIKEVEEDMHEEFGSKENPLLLSVRSGAAVSDPPPSVCVPHLLHCPASDEAPRCPPLLFAPSCLPPGPSVQYVICDMSLPSPPRCLCRA